LQHKDIRLIHKHVSGATGTSAITSLHVFLESKPEKVYLKSASIWR